MTNRSGTALRRQHSRPVPFLEPLRALRLDATCLLIGVSRRTGERWLSEGKFPVPMLPRREAKRGSPYRFSTADIRRYLEESSTADLRPRRNRLR